MIYVKRSPTIEALTFDEFVQFGRDNGANIVNGMPWSFKYKDRAVTHENDSRYIIAGTDYDLRPGLMLVTMADGHIEVRGQDTFLDEYMEVELLTPNAGIHRPRSGPVE